MDLAGQRRHMAARMAARHTRNRAAARLASAGPARPSPHRPVAAPAVHSVGGHGAENGVRGPSGGGVGVGSRGGDGAAASDDEEQRSSVSHGGSSPEKKKRG